MAKPASGAASGAATAGVPLGGGGSEPSDAALSDALAEGGTDAADTALDLLYRRHRPAVLAYARVCCRDPHTAEDLASEAFTRTLQALRGGGGPRDAWRPYLLAVVRRTAADWYATARRTELSPDFERWLADGEGLGPDAPDPALSAEERVLHAEDSSLVLRGFRSLPERWQAVLWHTVVEDEPASRVGVLLGIGASGVASLAARAREGLREAYLVAHLDGADDECRHYGALLGSQVRRTGRRPSRALERHLEECARCRGALLELTELNERMRAVLPAGLLLWGGSAYLAARLASPDAAGAGPADGGGAGPGTAAGGGKTLLAVGAAAVTVTAAVLGYVFLAPSDADAPPRAAPPAAREPATPPPATVTTTATPTPRTSASAAAPATPSPSRTSAPPAWRPAADFRTTLRVSASKNCMEPTAAGVREASCDGGADQVWELLYTQGEDGGQLVRLRNKGTGECLASPGTSEDGGAVTPEVCKAAADGQLWRIGTDTQGHHMTFQLPAANLRLGLNDWHQAGEGKPHDATIGTTHNYYGSPSLYFDYEGTAPA